MKRKVACLLADGFEDSEFKMPCERLRQAGFEVDVVGLQKGQTLTGKAGREKAQVTCSIDEASVVNYTGLLIPGGHSPEKLREDERVLEFVRQFDSCKKPIAAICHGPQLLISAGLCKGRQLTAYRDVQQELQGTGAIVKDEALVSDGNWITSRKPDDLPQFCEALALQLDVNADQSWMARGDVHPQP